MSIPSEFSFTSLLFVVYDDLYYNKEDEDVFKFLLERGANLYQEDSNGKFMVSSKLKPNRRRQKPRQYYIELLKRHDFDFGRKDATGKCINDYIEST